MAKIDAVELLGALFEEAVEHHQLWAMHQLNRLAAEIIVHELTPTFEGKVGELMLLIADMQRRELGRITSTWDSQGSRRSGSDPRLTSMSKRADVEQRILRGLGRPALRALVAKSSAAPLYDKLTAGCKACRHKHATEINRRLESGQTVRDVAEYTASTGDPISKSTLHTHFRHAIQPTQTSTASSALSSVVLDNFGAQTRTVVGL